MKPEIHSVGGLQDQSPHISLPAKEGAELTVALLKTFPGCEHYTDEQAQEIVHTIKQLGEILYYLVIPEQSHTIDSWADSGTEITLPGTNESTTQNMAA